MENAKPKNNITIKDIAQELGIAASTVSRALNDHPKISKKRKDDVLNKALEMGYSLGVSNLLMNEKSSIIALIIPSVKDGFYGQVYRGFNEYCLLKGYSLLVLTSFSDALEERKCFEHLLQINPLACIYISATEDNEIPALQVFLQKKLPLVIIHESALQSNVSTFIMDREKAISDALGHLSSSSIKKPLLLIDDAANPLGSPLELVFRREVEMQDMELIDTSVRRINSDKECRFLLDEIYNKEIEFDAILTSSYILALRIQNFLLTRKTEFDAKILLLSLDAHETSSISRPKISYIDFQSSKVAEQIMKLIQSQIVNGFVNETKIFSPKLVIQSSSIRW
ncbi:LacI family DNA-binding transcriptional regulator [Lentimicrobium sp. L6]|uniref:LacI family DNA-binding transcriptional regulator n=3 Tax=unclassified Lentimicrobium TaxID=2677434 RepID=UPI0015522739|nr:LacI family DNA-binding transcriptional regulator [Lentimicrobium sp. L6]NPD86499.1 LacI family DNA-binding transcriptional regulator [Lentimicrobium sp. L6]